MMKNLLSGITVILLFTLLFSLFFIPAAGALDPLQPTPSSGPSDPAEVEAFLDSTIPALLAEYNVPGATVAVVKDGELVLAKGYGYANLRNRTAVNADQTLFHIGSTTKLFTWTAVMQLVAEGTIDLDADVNTYLNDFRIPDTYPGSPVTMRHLMTHTAGFEDVTRHSTVLDVKDLISYRDYCANNIPERVWPPGEVSSYSNYGTVLAGIVVEDVSGMPFDEYLRSRILSPLGMNRTSIQVVLPPELAYNLSQGFVYTSGMNRFVPDDLWVIGPAGSISSTAPDMARFLAAHMLEGTYRNVTILPADTASLMHARAFANDPRVSGMCLGFYEMVINNRRLIGHGGDTLTFHSLLVIIPEEQAGFFVSFNSIGGKQARNELLTAFMDHYYPDETPVLQPGPSSASGVQQYAGTYESNRHNYAGFEKFFAPWARMEITATPDGTLLMPEDGQVTELVETEQGVFSRLDGTQSANGDIVFHTRSDGTVAFFSMANVPFLVFDRVPWQATTGFVDNLKTTAGIILATVLLWPLLFVFRRVYPIPEPSVPQPAHLARWISGAAALILLVFTAVLLPWMMETETLIAAYAYDQTIPFLLIAVLTLPVVAAVLTLVSVVFIVIAWKEQYWTILHRVHYTIITVALFAMVWWVNFNNVWVFCL